MTPRLGTPLRRRVVVLGGGVVGASCAWQLARRGHAVTLLDPAAGAGASRAAAGMLAPASEAVPGQERLLRAGLASARSWPGFAARLSADVGRPVVLAPRATLLVAHDADDAAVLRRHAQHLRRHGCGVEALTSRTARRLEPALSPRVTAALRVEETAVEPRSLVAALLEAMRISQDVRRYAAERGLDGPSALEAGMADKSRQFLDLGASVYVESP